MTIPPNQLPQGSPISYESVALTLQDVEHLKVLSICWWVIAGMQCLGMCVGGVYLVLGILFAAGVIHDKEAATMGIVFSCLGAFLVLLSITLASLSFLVGKSLRQRRRMTLCYVMAGLACLSIPLGTTLGVFTFIVLSRPSVKASFH